jgi:hypothetical protein
VGLVSVIIAQERQSLPCGSLTIITLMRAEILKIFSHKDLELRIGPVQEGCPIKEKADVDSF